MKGKLITFEGIEGCGKSTQLRLLSAWLGSKGIPHTCTREPGGTEVGSKIRQIVLSEQTGNLAAQAEVALYLADRFQHIESVIRPKMEAGELVLSDRYHDSTVAYQGYARGLSLSWIDAMWKGSGLALVPNLTFVFDVDPQTGVQRSLRKLHNQQLDESRFEKESLEFHQRVRDGFLELARLERVRFRVVDASGTEDTIHNSIVEILETEFKEYFGR